MINIGCTEFDINADQDFYDNKFVSLLTLIKCKSCSFYEKDIIIYDKEIF